jgi:hypothetical protein
MVQTQLNQIALQTQQLISLQSQQLVALQGQQLGYLSQLVKENGSTTQAPGSYTNPQPNQHQSFVAPYCHPIHQATEPVRGSAVVKRPAASNRLQQLEKEKKELQVALDKERRDRLIDIEKRDVQAAFYKEKMNPQLAARVHVPPATRGTDSGQKKRRGRRLSLSQVMIDSAEAGDISHELASLQRGSGSTEQKLPRERKMHAAEEEGCSQERLLSLSSNLTIVKAVVKMQSNLRRSHARKALMKHLQQHEDTILAMAGTVQGRSGWYEFVAPDDQIMVVQYRVSEDGEWKRKMGPMRKQVYKEAFEYTNERRRERQKQRQKQRSENNRTSVSHEKNERLADRQKGSRSTGSVEQVQGAPKTLSLGTNVKVVEAVVKLQSCLRRSQARKAVMKQLQSSADTVLAMAGTVQGQSGWYEFVVPDGQLMAVQYKVGEDGEWKRKKGPMRKQVYKEAFELANKRRRRKHRANKQDKADRTDYKQDKADGTDKDSIKVPQDPVITIPTGTRYKKSAAVAPARPATAYTINTEFNWGDGRGAPDGPHETAKRHVEKRIRCGLLVMLLCCGVGAALYYYLYIPYKRKHGR